MGSDVACILDYLCTTTHSESFLQQTATRLFLRAAYSAVYSESKYTDNPILTMKTTSLFQMKLYWVKEKETKLSNVSQTWTQTDTDQNTSDNCNINSDQSSATEMS